MPACSHHTSALASTVPGAPSGSCVRFNRENSAGCSSVGGSSNGEFTGSLLTYLDGTPTADKDETYSMLQQKLEGTGLVATTPGEAQDVNGFYVTSETAEKYGLTNVSDLTKTQS